MENEKLSPVEEAMSALIAELDEETLNKAVGGIDQKYTKCLLKAGLIIAATGAGAGCYWWKRKPKTPNVTKPSGYISSSNGDRASQIDESYAKKGFTTKTRIVNSSGATHTRFADDDRASQMDAVFASGGFKTTSKPANFAGAVLTTFEDTDED